MIGAHRTMTGEVTLRRDEHPLRRKNPSGEVRWIARWTDRNEKRNVGWKDAGIRGTHAKRGPCKTPADDGNCCAQHAIYACYERDAEAPQQIATVGQYAKTWLRLHPRSERTEIEYEGRLKKVLGVELEGKPFGELPLSQVERRHGILLVDVLLTDHGRAVSGAQAVLQTLSAMWQDALDDGYVKTANPFLRLKVRRNDKRVTKAARIPRVWAWQEMHRFAAATGHEAMVRTLCDCGLRLGEMLALQERDLKLGHRCDELSCRVEGPHLHVRRRAWRDALYEGTKSGGERVRERVAPLPPVLASMLAALWPSPGLSTAMLFPSPAGGVWEARRWRSDVWYPARKATGMVATPHEFRHSWVSRVRASGVDVADAAAAAGHNVDTANRVYTHPLGESFDAIRAAVGE